MIGIWGTTATIPTSWAEATEYRGLFLRGHGSVSHTKNNGSKRGNTATTHSSGNIGAIQGDTVRKITGKIDTHAMNSAGGDGVFAHYYRAAEGGVVTDNVQGLHYFDFDNSRVTPTANEIRPVNKAVKYIKHTALTLANIPETPNAPVNYRYIAKVRH